MDPLPLRLAPLPGPTRACGYPLKATTPTGHPMAGTRGSCRLEAEAGAPFCYYHDKVETRLIA